ncbi:cell division protein PerM [Agromyces bauzanensis]
MRRTTIALLAALEASVTALVGFGAAFVPLVLLWAVHFGMAVEFTVFLRAAADVWLIGHGVDLTVQLDPITAARVAVPGAGDPFPVTIALLGFALVSVTSGMRIGRRSAAGGHSFSGGIAAILVFGLAGFALALVSATDAARADPWQGALLPASVMALGVVIGAVGESLREASATDAATGLVRRALTILPPAVVAGARGAVRVGAGTAFGVLALAGVLVAVLIAIDYATIAGLYQTLGAGIDGGLALTVAELALLPNVVVWAASWLLGPGFAIGSGSLVSSSGTLLGPVPGFPLLGALPTDAPALGALWLVVPVLLSFVGAWLVSSDPVVSRDGDRAPWWAPLAGGLGSAAVAAFVLGLLAWWSGGAAGPGRLAEVGPEPWLVAGVAAATVGLGAIVGGYAAYARSARSSRPGDPADGGRFTYRDDEPEPAYRDDEPEPAHREFIWGADRRRDVE